MWVAITLGVAIAMGIVAAIWKPSTPEAQKIDQALEQTSEEIIEEVVKDVITENKS